MDKWKLYMKNQWQKLRAHAAVLVSGTEHSDHGGAPVIELDPQSYEQLKIIADRGQTSVEAIVRRAIKIYTETLEQEANRYIPPERKEKNPLLHLDAMTKTYKKRNDADRGMVQ